MNTKQFIKEIGFPEFKSMIGGKIVILIFLLLISLLAVGIAKGGQEYLKKRMEDPFFRFIDIEVDFIKIEKPGGGYFPEFNKDAADNIASTDYYQMDPIVSSVRLSSIEFSTTEESGYGVYEEGVILEEKNKFYEILKTKNLYFLLQVI